MKSGTLPVTVDLLGVNERMRNTFAMVFAGPAKAVARMADGRKADLVIVDADGVGARELWQTFRQKNPGCPAIAISAAATELDGVVATLHKPVKIDLLIEAIGRLVTQAEPAAAATGMPESAANTTVALAGAPPNLDAARQAAIAENEDRTQTVPTLRLPSDTTVSNTTQATVPEPEKDFTAVCGTADAIDCSDEAQIDKLFLPLAGRLLGILLEAAAETGKTEQAIALQYGKNILAVFSPDGRIVSVAADDALLQRLSQKIFPEAALLLKKIAPAATLPPGSRNAHPNALLWKVAAWTYRGQLPAGLSPNQRIYLRHWPNLTRLLELPDAMRIAALLNEQPMSMCRIAEVLQIPQRHVFAFCACAHTIGLLGLAKRAADHLFEPPVAPPAHGERKFFGRVMHYLKGLMTR